MSTKDKTERGVTVLNVSGITQENIKGGSVLVRADSYEALKKLGENSIDSCVCDPPYLLNFMGKEFDREKNNPADDVEFWQLVLRVLKPGAHLLAAGIGRTHHRLMIAIEDSGFEIRDCIYHAFGSGFPKSLNIQKQLQKMGSDRADDFAGYGTALKPAIEIWTLARKPLSEKTVAENVLKWGTGGLNIDGTRITTEDALGRKNNVPPYGNDRTWQVSKTPPQDNRENAPQGRWPSNFIHDGSYKVVEMFPNNAARFFYCAKASKAERNKGLEGFEEKFSPTMGDGIGGKEHNPETATKKQNHHPTVKPTSLMRYLCKLVTPPQGTVLDPFLGSGTTGIAAKLEGFNFIGIEKEPEYVEIAKARIQAWEKEAEQNRLL